MDPAPSWRQAFLIERGKMTTDRFAKIRHTISLFANQTSNSNGTAIYRRLSRQEMLAIECLKPKFQNPCQPLQSRKCVKKKNGAWKMISCTSPNVKSLFSENENDKCDCQEKRLVKKFLDRHVNR